jgi:hypothetical protein
MGWVGMDWIHLAQDSDQRRSLVNTVVSNIVFLDVAPQGPFMKRRFGGTCRLHLQVQKILE